MAASSHLNGRERREPFPKKEPARAPGRMSGDLIVMAALIGISRAFFGPKKQGTVRQSLSGLQETITLFPRTAIPRAALIVESW